MTPVATRDESRAFDSHAIARGVPSIVLMENAGRGAADVIVRDVAAGTVRGARVVIVCGGGNNGGDGYVVARHLAREGADVQVLATHAAARLKGDAQANHAAWLAVGGTVHEVDSTGPSALDAALGDARFVVDAVFGTGLDRPVAGALADVIRAMSAAPGRRVALDVPSGLDANTGAALGVAFDAHHTITFGHVKQGLVTSRGAAHAGRVHLVDIGVPTALPGLAPSKASLLERADVARLLPPRALGVHKHGNGHVAVLAGSAGKIGAALMVARAALRTGAGLATIATWAEAVATIQGRVVEEMTATLTRGAVAASLAEALKGKRAVVVGPGFGLDDDARAAVDALLATWAGPLVVDADALTLFAGRADAFARTSAKVILTPHAGELARLLGITSDAVEADRFAAARALAEKARAVVVLKGPFSLIARPDGYVAVNPTGGPALATAGSGDTLGGIVSALACTLDPFDAASAAVYVHGLAGDAWSKAHGDRGLLASEIADQVPAVLRALTLDHT